MKKDDLRSASDQEKEALRKRAIRMIGKGINKTQVAELLGVSRNSVNTWHRKYKEQGQKGLKENKRGLKKGARRLLSHEQAIAIQAIITDKMPEQLRLPYGLWTRKAIRDLIKREFNIVLAVRTMGDYLQEWGFTPQKPKKRAYEQNDKKVQQWLKEAYPAISKQAKEEGAEIHWGDETGIKNDCQYGRSYAPKGKTPVKDKMGKRLSLNMISTVTNQGKVRFMTYKGSMDADRFVEFLKRLVKNAEKKIYLILDNLRVHHSKIVKTWVEENQDKISLYYLPSYSPERNPDEYLNCDLKYGLSQKVTPKNEQDLASNVNSHMRLLQKNPKRVAKYFKHQSIKYAAA